MPDADAIDRRHVTPADPAATILDPSRGRPLPPEGAPVVWGPYWALLAGRGDVTVADASPAAAAAPAARRKTEEFAAPRT